MKIWSIEGNRQWLDGGSLFGSAPRMLWQQWVEPDDRNRIELACRCLLAEDLNGLNVLFEAGVGAFFEPKLKQRFGVQQDEHVLLHSLQARGFPHDEIDIVVLSHLHFDHAGGILSAYEADQPLRLLFPKAKFLVGDAAWERARNPHPRDRASFVLELPQLLEASGRLELVHGDRSATLG
ncbi:MAG: MBL fold metallo-hydrolase, partial [Gammaproteobacteria bacterium]